MQFPRFQRTALAIALGTISASVALAQTGPQPTAPMTAQEKKNLQFVLDWWRQVIQARHVELAEKYQAEDYIQHNPNIPTGRAAFVKVFGSRPPVNPIPDQLNPAPVVTFAKGDYVGLIWEREDKDPTDPSKMYHYNTFDVIRIENGKIQEHWDSAVKNPPPPGGSR